MVRLEIVSVVSYQDAADAGVDLSEDVAHHVQGGHQAELHGVVHHHADKHDVARVLVENPGNKQQQQHDVALVLVEHSGTQTTTTTTS